MTILNHNWKLHSDYSKNRLKYQSSEGIVYTLKGSFSLSKHLESQLELCHYRPFFNDFWTKFGTFSANWHFYSLFSESEIFSKSILSASIAAKNRLAYTLNVSISCTMLLLLQKDLCVCETWCILYSIISLFGDSPFSGQVKKSWWKGLSSGGKNGWPEVGSWLFSWVVGRWPVRVKHLVGIRVKWILGSAKII